MYGLQIYQKVLLVLQILAVIGLLARMFASGLHRVYRYFFLYLLVLGVQLAIPFLIRERTDTYAYFFLATEGLIVCFYALIVLELYSLVLRDLHGIARIAKSYVQIAIAAAIVVSLILLALEPIRNPASHKFDSDLVHFYNFERAIVYSLVFFVVLITAFLVYYPIPLSRNVIYYSIGYGFYFTTKALAIFLQYYGPEWARIPSLTAVTASTACLIFWACFLTEQGQAKTMVLAHKTRKWDAEDEQRLLRQLDAINASLLRARK